MDVGLHRRGIEPESVPLDPRFGDGGLGQQAVDVLPGLRPDLVPELAVGREVDHGSIEDADETPQEVAVVDADDDLPQRAPLDDLTQYDAQESVLRGLLVLT